MSFSALSDQIYSGIESCDGGVMSLAFLFAFLQASQGLETRLAANDWSQVAISTVSCLLSAVS